MNQFHLVDESGCIPIIVEAQAYEGVYKIAEKSASDFELVSGKKPEINRTILKGQTQVILYATIGRSKLLDELIQTNKICLNPLIGQRETYGMYVLEQPWDGVDQALIIAGSDKRGTIYGIFHLSEKIGVSPLVFWGDAKPLKKSEITVDKSMNDIAKEPSVRYRGFFINDEWPCFGNWAMNHFNGFSVEMYDHVFELLLRLKGNYLWPAMWTSSFALDGPGDKNAILADEYGVIIGNSHHEPCLRASEEWDLYKGENTGYGTKWNYTTNKKGLLAYWEDGLKRSGKFESIITVGMRGERDSAIAWSENAILVDSLDADGWEMRGYSRLINRQGEFSLIDSTWSDSERMAMYHASQVDFSKAIALQPEIQLSYYYRSQIYLASGDTTSALKDLERFLLVAGRTQKELIQKAQVQLRTLRPEQD